jgi:ketosteroid isomerase-like protein
MAKTPNDELHEAYGHFARVSDECAASADYNAFADLFTDDCTYIEHVFGEMHGREAVRRATSSPRPNAARRVCGSVSTCQSSA